MDTVDSARLSAKSTSSQSLWMECMDWGGAWIWLWGCGGTLERDGTQICSWGSQTAGCPCAPGWNARFHCSCAWSWQLGCQGPPGADCALPSSWGSMSPNNILTSQWECRLSAPREPRSRSQVGNPRGSLPPRCHWAWASMWSHLCNKDSYWPHKALFLLRCVPVFYRCQWHRSLGPHHLGGSLWGQTILFSQHGRHTTLGLDFRLIWRHK